MWRLDDGERFAKMCASAADMGSTGQAARAADDGVATSMRCLGHLDISVDAQDVIDVESKQC